MDNEKIILENINYGTLTYDGMILLHKMWETNRTSIPLDIDAPVKKYLRTKRKLVEMQLDDYTIGKEQFKRAVSIAKEIGVLNG